MLRCEWLYGDRLMRNFASATIAPGKSSLVLAEAIAVAIGRGLLGIMPAPALQGVVLERREPGRRN
jgi:hypothetical protein